MSQSRHWWTRTTAKRRRGAESAGALERHADYRTSAEALELAYREGFREDDQPSVGLEEELILVDPGSFAPVENTDWLLAELADGCFVPELRTGQIELSLPPKPVVSEARRQLVGARGRLLDTLAGRLRMLAAGGHPTLAGPMPVTAKPRYLQIEAEYGWATRRGLPSGLHVHVQIGDPDEALAIFNACRGYLPELAALAANSPFFEGADSGLASSRLKLSEDFPRSGIPPAFASWRQLAEFVSWADGGGLFPDSSYLWWDLRLRPEYGTLEFRVADAQTSTDDSAAIAALCQTLVVALRERLRAGEQLPAYPTHFLAENRWRAIRDGLDGILVDPASGLRELTRDRLTRLLLELEPYARSVGCADELAHAWSLVASNGASRQRTVARRDGVDRLVEWLAAATEQPSRLTDTAAPEPAVSTAAPAALLGLL